MKFILLMSIFMISAMAGAEQPATGKSLADYQACFKICDAIDDDGERYSCIDECGKVKAMSVTEWQNAMKSMPAGNVEQGKKRYEKSCAGCHGEQAIPNNTAYPVLAGQRPLYLYKMLLDYRDNRMVGKAASVNSNTMSSQAAGLNDKDIADLAAYLASLPRPRRSTGSETIPKIAKGDHSRLLPPCESCHGANGQGWQVQPALQGQHRAHCLSALEAFKKGMRTNDINSGMAVFAHLLTEEEIKAVTDYFCHS